MKKKIYLGGFLVVLVGIINLCISYNNEYRASEVNLNTLLSIVAASASGGEYTCDCVKCPEEEHGCLEYDYVNNQYNNSGTESHFCPGKGRGWIEKHAIDEGVRCD